MEDFWQTAVNSRSEGLMIKVFNHVSARDSHSLNMRSCWTAVKYWRPQRRTIDQRKNRYRQHMSLVSHHLI